MSIFFFSIILSSTVLAFYYLWENNFNSETQAVIFPAIGAILFSGYLGYKSILIDAPVPTKRITNIVLLQDIKCGRLIPMLPADRDSFSFRGLERLGKYQLYNAFKDIDAWKSLKDANDQDRSIGNLLEYAIIDWFAQGYTSIGYEDLGGGSGGVKQWPDLVPTAVDNEWNPFIKASEIKLRLPQGSKIRRNRVGPFFNFTIETPHSSIAIRMVGIGVPGASVSLAEKKKIIKILSLPDNTSILPFVGTFIEIKTNQKPFSRYSDQAKLEATWLKRIPELFEEDFSWDKLRRYYASYTPTPLQ